MSSGPIKDALQPSVRLVGINVQSRRKSSGFVQTEVSEIDPLPDVEGRASGVLDELVRCRDAKQHEGQALEVGLSGPGVEAGAEGCEEIVREREPDRRIDLVHEDHDTARAVCQHEFAEEIGEALDWRQVRPFLPPRAQRSGDFELLVDLVGDPEIPLRRRLGSPLAPDLGEIHDGRGDAGLLQSHRSPRH
jgi:hypothetical protein